MIGNMQNTQLNVQFSGFYKIWKVHKVTGQKELLVSKPNLVLYQGADLLAQSLAGVKYAHISHMYIGYSNQVGFVTANDAPVIDKENSIGFQNYGAGIYSDLGYVRIPLAYNPTYVAQANYENNIAIFTTVVSTTDGSFGAPFNDSLNAPVSNIFEVGLAAALTPDNSAGDKIFSRANFESIVYDSNYNLTISWGINFTA